MKAAMVAPAPGSTPTTKPSSEDRAMVRATSRMSLAVSFSEPTLPRAACRHPPNPAPQTCRQSGLAWGLFAAYPLPPMRWNIAGSKKRR
jgi:hypothetical protein